MDNNQLLISNEDGSNAQQQAFALFRPAYQSDHDARHERPEFAREADADKAVAAIHDAFIN